MPVALLIFFPTYQNIINNPVMTNTIAAKIPLITAMPSFVIQSRMEKPVPKEIHCLHAQIIASISGTLLL